MSTDYNQNYLLTNPPANKRPEIDPKFSPAHSIRKLNKKLNLKKLIFDQSSGKVFFSNPYELFACLVKKNRQLAHEVKLEICECIREVSDWKKFMPELEFLQSNKLVLSQFLRNPDSPIFWGFLLILLSALYEFKLKIYQLYQGKSLVSYEIGNFKESEKILRLAVLIFPDGFKFIVLQKLNKNAQPKFDFSPELNDIRFENKLYEIQLNKNDVNALRILTENLGFFSQLMVDYSDFLAQKEFYGKSKRELSQIFDNIVKIATITDVNSKETSTRILHIENLGIENLNSRLKADLIFGNRVIYNPFQRIQENEFNLNFSQNKPPGLKEKYLEGNLVLQNLDLQNLQIEKKETGDKSFFKFDSVETSETPNKKKEEGEPNQKEAKSFKDIAAVKPIILDQDKNLRFVGRLKFVNEKGKYGFLIKEQDGSDIFFHVSDMENAGISCDKLVKNKDMKFSFSELKYIGRHNISKKAVDLKVYQDS